MVSRCNAVEWILKERVKIEKMQRREHSANRSVLLMFPNINYCHEFEVFKSTNKFCLCGFWAEMNFSYCRNALNSKLVEWIVFKELYESVKWNIRGKLTCWWCLLWKGLYRTGNEGREMRNDLKQRDPKRSTTRASTDCFKESHFVHHIKMNGN